MGTPLGKTQALPAGCISQVHFGWQFQTFCCSPFQVGELKVSSTVIKKEEKFSIPLLSDFKIVTVSYANPFYPDVSLLPSSFQVFCCLLLMALRSIQYNLVQCHLSGQFQRITDHIFPSVEL